MEYININIHIFAHISCETMDRQIDIVGLVGKFSVPPDHSASPVSTVWNKVVVLKHTS